MKKLSIGFLLLTAIVSGCQKSADDSATSFSGNGGTNQVAAPLPTASFRINNASNGIMSEATVLQIENLSLNAVSYKWNFGDGNVSSEKNPYFFYAMHGDYIVKLTVANKDGKISAMSIPITAFCCRTSNPNHAPFTEAIH